MCEDRGFLRSTDVTEDWLQPRQLHCVALALKLVMELVTKLDSDGFNPSRPLVLSTISASC